MSTHCSRSTHCRRQILTRQRKWQKEDIELVKQGKVPEGRSYAQAAAYAHAHGIAWGKLRAKDNKWYWKPEEKEMLARGEIPPGRSEAACVQARRLFKIKVQPIRKFSRDELRAAARGRGTIPERQLERMCKDEGLALPVNRLPKDSRRRMRAEALAEGQTYVRKQFLHGPMSRGEYIWLMHESGLSYHEIGRRLGITGTRAQSLASAYESKPA